MKVYKLIVMTIVFFGITACNSDDSDTNNSLNDGSVQVDYIIDIDFSKDITVSNDEAFVISQGNPNGGFSLTLEKINQNGEITDLDEISPLFGNHMGLAVADNGALYYVTDGNNEGHKVYKYSPSTSETTSYEITPISSPFAGPVRMSAIENFGDGTFIVFDYSVFGLRRYVPELETDIIIAGSRSATVTDGTGMDASFEFITKMQAVPNEEAIYVIDGSNNLRKVEKNGNDFNVTTLVADYENDFADVTVNSNGDILVLVESEGIYKLNTSNNTLDPYLTGDVRFSTNANSFFTTNYSSVREVFVFSDDIYLYFAGDLIKVSDYESKLFE